MKHTISVGSPWLKIGEIVWDDVAGTVTGTIDGNPSNRSILPELSSMISNGPVIVGCPWGAVELQDPAHDPADFLRALMSVVLSIPQITLPQSLANVTPTPFPPLPHPLSEVHY